MIKVKKQTQASYAFALALIAIELPDDPSGLYVRKRDGGNLVDGLSKVRFVLSICAELDPCHVLRGSPGAQ